MSIRSLARKSIVAFYLAAASMLAGAQQFQQPTVIPAGNWPTGVSTADLNRDGKPDLIYTDFGATSTASTTHILLSNGDGTFTPAQTFATAGTAIAVADIDNDGNLDLIWVWGVVGEGRVYYAAGHGDGTFADPVQLGTFAIVGTRSPQFPYIKAAQLHESGYLDLLVEDAANPSLITITMDPNGTIVRLIGTVLKDGIGPMLTADLNGDGHLDLIIHALAGNVANVFLGSANGILQAPTSYPGVHSLLLHDMDNDSHLDMVVEKATGQISILHGNPDGTFATTPEGGTLPNVAPTGAGGHLIAVSDASGSRHNLYTATPAGISLLLDDGRLNYSLGAIYNAGPGRSSFAVADFNGDGTQDLAIDSPEGVAILFANADGSLQTSRSFSAGKPALAGKLGAFNSTGNLDEIVNISPTQTQFLQGNGDGTFTTTGAPASVPALTTSPVTLTASGDLNHDGKNDLVTRNGSTLTVSLNRGDGTYTRTGDLQDVPASLTAASLTIADLDGDGNGDIVVAFDNAIADHAHPAATSANVIAIWYGRGDGTFEQPVFITPSRNFYQLAIADLDGDTRPDLVLSDGYVVSLQMNRGNRIFSPEAHLLGGMGINTISAGDVNHDGIIDLVLANGGTVFSNLPNGVLVPNVEVSNGGITVLLTHLTTPPPPATAQPETTVVALTSSLNPATQGKAVSLIATVQSSRNIPAGTVTFFDGTLALGTMALDTTGSATLRIATLATGLHSITASYGGATSSLPSTSAALQQTIVAAPAPTVTTTTLASNANPSSSGQTITLTAIVAANAGSIKIPTGSVTFFDNGAVLGSALLDGAGLASINMALLTPGSHSLTDIYAGDGTSAPSASAVLMQVVNVYTTTTPSGFTISAEPVMVSAGKTASIVVSVSPVRGFNQAVALTCSNLPSESECNFASGMIAAGGGATSLQFSTLAPRACGSSTPYSASLALPFGGPLLATLVCFFLPRRHRVIKGLLMALCCLAGLTAITGCASACTNLGTRPGVYTINITGTALGATQTTISQQVTVTVTY